MKYTDEQREFLKLNSPKMSRKELTEAFNRMFGQDKTVDAIRTFCKKNGYYAPTDGRYQKGNKTWSTGLSKEEHRKHFSDESYANVIGNLDARKTKGIGDEYQMKFGNDTIPYVVVSLDYSLPFKKRIMPKTRYVWEQAHGPLPEGHCIIHLDGDVQNCELDNLMAVSNYERLVLNGNHWSGKGELTKAGVLYARLTKGLNER